jgi:hypothetical protein
MLGDQPRGFPPRGYWSGRRGCFHVRIGLRAATCTDRNAWDNNAFHAHANPPVSIRAAMNTSQARYEAIAAATAWNANRHKNGSRKPTRSASSNSLFGRDVFSRRVMRQRMPKDIFKRLIRDDRLRHAAGCRSGGSRRLCHEGLGGRERRDALHALVPAAHRFDRGEARFAHRPRRPWRNGLRACPAKRSCRANRMPRHSHQAGCARHSKHAAIPHGTPPAPRSSCVARTPSPSASPLHSSRGPGKRSIRRPPCCARWTRSASRRCAS